MRNPKYHIYLTPDKRRTVISSLIDLRNNLISQGIYTDLVDELLIRISKTKAKKTLPKKSKKFSLISTIQLQSIRRISVFTSSLKNKLKEHLPR